jgi:phosphate starvation-inducible PhoH-like protein
MICFQELSVIFDEIENIQNPKICFKNTNSNESNQNPLQEIEIRIEAISPHDIFGVNNENFQLLKSHFNKLKLVTRGSIIKAIGDAEELKLFESKFQQLVDHFGRFSSLTENQVERILKENGEAVLSNDKDSEVLVYGTRGIRVKARTFNQRRMVEAIDRNDLVFAEGPAGTGKTYTAVALAVRALKNKEVRRLILTRPAVEAGESLGFLPGDLKEKLDPYLRPLYDALRDMIPSEKLSYFIEAGIIEIAPLAFMRGRTLDHAFVILDEAQNTTVSQIRMFLTRMGKHAKFVITGDITQVDLPRNLASGLSESIDRLKEIDGIGVVRLDHRDVIRHRLVRNIIEAFEN